MRDWKMWHKNAGRENAGLENAAQCCIGWKMQEWKKREKKTMERRMQNNNLAHSAHRMHELNNAAKDASLSVYFQPGMSRPTCSILQTEITDDYDNGTYTRIQFLTFYAPSATALDRTLSVQKTAVRSRTSMMMTTRRRMSASTVATTSRQRMLDLRIFAKSA